MLVVLCLLLELFPRCSQVQLIAKLLDLPNEIRLESAQHVLYLGAVVLLDLRAQLTETLSSLFDFPIRTAHPIISIVNSLG